MKAIIVIGCLFITILVHAQDSKYFYFDKSDRLVENPTFATKRMEIKYISEKKFEILVSGKNAFGKWSDGRILEIVTHRKKGFEVIRDLYSRFEVNTLISVVDTLVDGYLIREYHNGFCFREAEVKHVFPLVLNGKCDYFPINRDERIRTKYYWNNLEYSKFPQPQGSGDDSIMTASILKPDQWPQYPGGDNQFFKDINNLMVFGSDINPELLKGIVWISAKVDTVGTLGRVKLVKGIYPEVDTMLLKTVTFLGVPWMPGITNGKVVEIEYLFPFAFSVVDKKPMDKVFTVVDQMPIYADGKQGLQQTIASNIRYPVEAQERKIQGTVFVSFEIDTNGILRNARVARGAHPLLDIEAIRVVKTLKSWTPGIQDGQRVCVSYTVPINFRLR